VSAKAVNRHFGNLVDLVSGEIFPAAVTVAGGRIARVDREAGPFGTFLVPGFVDAHIHVESSMLSPAEFGRAVSVHGTVATVSDPHEIANVCGVPGIDYMLREARKSPVRILFGAPPCVPATPFETSGATLDAAAVGDLLARPEIGYLCEVMNFPGVLAGEGDLLAKIAAARASGKPVDGHAPGLRGAAATAYAARGIGTDHECSDAGEARDKIAAGMKILIREGSAARNFAALEPLLHESPGDCMFCSDDLHPDAIGHGHIGRLVARAVAGGLDPITALRVASLQPSRHYGLGIGLLREGDRADFLEIEDLDSFRVRRTFIGGVPVAGGGRSLLDFSPPDIINRFGVEPLVPGALAVRCDARRADILCITVRDGELVTGVERVGIVPSGGELRADPSRDLLKLVVVNRYHDAPPAIAFVRNFGLERGALASSVAHDSHNIVAVGANDDDLCRAINLVIGSRGGISAVGGGGEALLPLPIAGLMSDRSYPEVSGAYADVESAARMLGSPLRAPMMALSFLALPVIPSLKLTDRGLFDVGAFRFVRAWEPAR